MCRVSPSGGTLEREMVDRVFRVDDTPRSERLPALLELPWEELEARLKGMSWRKLVGIMDMIGTVGLEAERTAHLGEVLKDRRALESTDKVFMIEMMRRYGVKGTSTVKHVFGKAAPSVRDRQLLIIRFKEVLERQSQSAALYARIRGWLVSAEIAKDLFRSQADYLEWLAENEKRKKAFEKLGVALMEFARSF